MQPKGVSPNQYAGENPSSHSFHPRKQRHGGTRRRTDDPRTIASSGFRERAGTRLRTATPGKLPAVR